MLISGKEYDVKNHTYIFGILNVTQDSFSDGGKYNTLDNALKRAEEMVNEGVHFIDIGGESTRPGFIPVEAEKEIEAVVPVIEALKREFDVPLSLDTRKAAVAKEGIRAKVDIINDVDGLKGDAMMAKTIADAGVSCIIMHNRNDRNSQTDYQTISHTLSEGYSWEHTLSWTNCVIRPQVDIQSDGQTTAHNSQIHSVQHKVPDTE